MKITIKKTESSALYATFLCKYEWVDLKAKTMFIHAEDTQNLIFWEGYKYKWGEFAIDYK